MPDRVNVANVTCPPNTLAAAPVEVFLVQFPPGIPRKLTVVIPDGHAGTTGIAFGYGHNPVLPDNAGAFISGNDETFSMDLHSYPAGPQWSVFMCNGDRIAHTWQVRFEFDEITGTTVDINPAPIPADDIAAAGDLSLDQGVSDNVN